MSSQIKSRKRVADFGEVYTAKRQVDDMLGLIPDMPIDATYLEPACGNGNFLSAILRDKMNLAAKTGDYRVSIVIAASSIYGVDIQEDNVIESRTRLFGQMCADYKKHTGAEPDDALCKTVRNILDCNIICGNTLTATVSNGQPLIFCEWAVRNNGHIICREFSFADMIAAGGECNTPIATHNYSWLVQKKPAAA